MGSLELTAASTANQGSKICIQHILKNKNTPKFSQEPASTETTNLLFFISELPSQRLLPHPQPGQLDRLPQIREVKRRTERIRESCFRQHIINQPLLPLKKNKHISHSEIMLLTERQHPHNPALRQLQRKATTRHAVLRRHSPFHPILASWSINGGNEIAGTSDVLFTGQDGEVVVCGM
jgi:hypothetical protein